MKPNRFPRIGRTLPPAAAPLTLREVGKGLLGLWRGKSEKERFEAELRFFFKVRHCLTVSSGKTALLLILLALKKLYPERTEVLIPAYNCFSVPSAILRAGLKIRLCDLDQNGLDFDFRQLEKIFSEPATVGRMLCIIPTHFFGLPADLARLKETMQATAFSSIPVVEDAAQAMGGSSGGGKLGSLGDIGLFSLGRGKSLSLGEGGIILTNREDLATALEPLAADLPAYSPPEICKLIFTSFLMSFLIKPWLFWLPKALPWLRLGETTFDPSFANRQLSAFQAGLARGWQAKLRKLQKDRQGKARIWTTMLEEGVCTFFSDKHGSPIRYPVRVREKQARDELLARSVLDGLGIMTTYPSSVAGVEALAGQIGEENDYPNAAALAEELLTLPVHQFVTLADQQRISSIVNGIIREGGTEKKGGVPCLSLEAAGRKRKRGAIGRTEKRVKWMDSFTSLHWGRKQK